MKNNSDYFKGFVLVLAAVLTYVVCQKQDVSFDSIYESGTSSKFRFLGLLLWLCFGHAYGAIAGVCLGFWFIFRKSEE